LEKVVIILKGFSSAKFWIFALLVTVATTGLSYIFSGIVIEGGYLAKYEALDETIKQLVSIEDSWIEMMLAGCIPMFLLFSIQFCLLRVESVEQIKNTLYSALPFVRYINWLANKPLYFILGTASALMGATLYLCVHGGSRYYVGLLIPLPIFALTFILRLAASQISTGKGFTSYTYKYCMQIGAFCAFISFCCWVYVDVYTPVSELRVLWTMLERS